MRPVVQSDKTALHIACEQDDVEMVELLLERVCTSLHRLGAPCDATSQGGQQHMPLGAGTGH